MKASTRLPIAGFAVVATTAVSAAPALAATTTSGPLTASTHVTNRSDSGGGGTWAKDDFTRTIQLTAEGLASPSHCAGQVPCARYSYKIVDGSNGGSNGGFVTVPGALAPNQGPGHAGQHVGYTFGSFGGDQEGDFYTSMPTSPAGFNVPANFSGNGVSSTNWPTLEWASPNLSKFFGLGADRFAYWYQATISHQRWIDAGGPGTDNCDGQCFADGQILH